MTVTATHRAVDSAPGTTPRPALLAGLLVALAVGMATASVVGPLVLGLMTYRTSPTTLNQLLGSDAAALVVVAPITVVAAVLAARRHPAAPVLATGIGVFTVYTYAQVIVGQEYLRLAGTVERWFPLLLAVFILGEGAIVLGLRGMPAQLPALPRRLERVAASALLLVAFFLAFGLHLRTLIIAWTDPLSLTEYASSPTPFWLVKLMDLGIVAPAAIAAGVGLWRHAAWARRVAYIVLTGYTLLAVSVTSMAAVMIAKDDPDASPALALGFGFFAVVFVVLTGALYRRLSLGTASVTDRRETGGGPLGA
ncbi:MAG TPA: hypothetical protein VMT69_05950 [Kineosporiaceae bacterium]|nr:hypothetical protein [Kineosporiaceae bacterium]